nr:hypothetical protein CFP56_64851 [Quercus suber]
MSELDARHKRQRPYGEGGQESETAVYTGPAATPTIRLRSGWAELCGSHAFTPSIVTCAVPPRGCMSCMTTNETSRSATVRELLAAADQCSRRPKHAKFDLLGHANEHSAQASPAWHLDENR